MFDKVLNVPLNNQEVSREVTESSLIPELMHVLLTAIFHELVT